MIRNNQSIILCQKMPARLNYTHEDFLNLFIIYGECDNVISRTCSAFTTRYPQKRKITLTLQHAY